ncbi:MAG: YraN family protein [Lachnospiraceae bacterium]|nr:YraN family protein [Lachnospiraceae bacterium]
MNKRKVGNEYEDLAVKYLEKSGYKILERNFYTRKGEIDIIAQDGEYLVFIEVKYRKDNESGTPEEAVDYRKQKRIKDSAMVYIYFNKIPMDSPMRFDVVSICREDVKIIKNAFWV